MLIYLLVQFFTIFISAYRGTREVSLLRKPYAYARLFCQYSWRLFVMAVWPPAWIRYVGKSTLNQARALVARKEQMESETKKLEKKERQETHHKGFKKASALRRRQALKRPVQGHHDQRSADACKEPDPTALDADRRFPGGTFGKN